MVENIFRLLAGSAESRDLGFAILPNYIEGHKIWVDLLKVAQVFEQNELCRELRLLNKGRKPDVHSLTKHLSAFFGKIIFDWKTPGCFSIGPRCADYVDYIIRKNIRDKMFVFNYVEGWQYDFRVSAPLASMWGSPLIIEGNFIIETSECSDFMGAPAVINGNLVVLGATIKSMRGFPDVVGGFVECDFEEYPTTGEYNFKRR